MLARPRKRSPWTGSWLLRAVNQTSRGWPSTNSERALLTLPTGEEVRTMDKNFHALVIDDEPQVREFVSAVLRGEDWAVTQSGSAEDAFARLGDAKWSVVFCDVRLGGADGFAVLRRFKQELPETKVVLMTGHGSRSEEHTSELQSRGHLVCRLLL